MSNMFLAGVDDSIKVMLITKEIFVLGTCPTRYLGLSESPKKWSKEDYRVLVEKIRESESHTQNICPLLEGLRR